MKIKCFCLIFIIFFLCLINVNAETFKCEYSFGKSGYEYIIEYDNENNSMKNLNEKPDAPATDYSYEYIYIDEEINSYSKGECPILYLKDELNCDEAGCDIKHTLYTDSFIREKSGIDECVSNRDENCLNIYFGSSVNYYTGVLKENSEINESEGNQNVSKCAGYNIIEKRIISEYEKYQNCTSADCVQYVVNAEKDIDLIKDLCNSMFQYRDINIKTSNDEYIQDACISICLNMGEEIDKLKEKYGVENSSIKLGQCGFSERLLIWIGNIVRWMKYIVPVIVIVLGILDFIKAMASSKEDEMKKAQKGFIIRLISAALIFIAPFIIEFVLEKMGFAANGCGIIDL